MKNGKPLSSLEISHEKLNRGFHKPLLPQNSGIEVLQYAYTDWQSNDKNIDDQRCFSENSEWIEANKYHKDRF